MAATVSEAYCYSWQRKIANEKTICLCWNLEEVEKAKKLLLTPTFDFVVRQSWS